jgi:tight adherence protein C
VSIALVVAALVVGGAWQVRPAPRRVLALVDGRRRRDACGSPAGALQGLGGVVRRAGGRRPDTVLDRRAGVALLVGLLGATVHPGAGLLAAGATWACGAWRVSRERERERRAVVDAAPDVVDLFVLAVDAGLTPRLAVEEIASRAPAGWGAALGGVVDEVRAGSRLADALETLPARVGDTARSLTVSLVDAERYGTPLGPALERLAAEAADDRRRRAEERARRVPVQLLFPLVLCTLPAFVLLTIVPLLAGSLRSISL